MSLSGTVLIIFFIVYFLFFGFICSKSGSTVWKLNSDETKVIEEDEVHAKVSTFDNIIKDVEILNIVSSTVYEGKTWFKDSNQKAQWNVPKTIEGDAMSGIPNLKTKCLLVQTNGKERVPIQVVTPPLKSPRIEENNLFHCGKPTNFTHYDSLIGVHNRFLLPNVTNARSASVFGYHTHNEVDIDETTLMIDFSDYIKYLIRCIKKARQQNSHSAPLYNYLGNYWQLKGNSLKSIECFRKGLSVSPHNARILLNLARLLFSLHYLDDAIYLTKRSLEMEQVQTGVWIHYFTLGEIFKAYGLYYEAIGHLERSLKLKPDLTAAKALLKEINSIHLSDHIHSNTIFIIILLVFSVLAIILLRHNFLCSQNGFFIFTVTNSARYLRHFRRTQRFRKTTT